MNQRLKITKFGWLVALKNKETMPNGPIKILNLNSEVLQLDVSNFKSTGRLI